MMFFGIILIGLVVYLVLRGNGQGFSSNSRQENSEDPMEILKQRFAKGSITEEEYIRIKNELNS